VLQRELQRLLARRRGEQLVAERREQLLQRVQALRLVVDEQDLRLRRRLGGGLGVELGDGFGRGVQCIDPSRPAGV
jgi:hypothetical protein